MKNVIITGPTGAIGVALIENLISNKINVTAVCREGSSRIKNIPSSPYVKVIECNLDKLSTLENMLLNDYDVFFHMGWESTFGDNRNNVCIQTRNIQYTLDAVELASKLGCRKFIGAGSQAEYGRSKESLSATTPTNPESAYGIAKLCAGQLSRIRCQQLGLEHIWVRILSVYGPCDGSNTMISFIIKTLLRQEKPSCTKGEQMWDYIYSKDAAKALVLLAKKGVNGKVYCLGSGQAVPLKNYMLSIRDRINPEIEIGLGEVPYGSQQVMYLCADISDLTKDTGFVPSITFEEGIEETIEWMKLKGRI